MAEKYSIKVNEGKKVVDMFVGGSFTPIDVQNFVKDYQKIVASVDVASYQLIIDCTTMDLLTQEMVPSLENSYRMYKESGFEKVIFTIKENAILKMQLSRLARNTGLTNVEVVNV
ncbi:hypothetical protein ACIQD3_16940 [Peribacillus loiseleuriae]|uniref:hypothetical protein n=1 Tax=Peribacillus loiseleuriae TaxID=1679170 RepID=UPI00380C052C